jgi:hypothetical protein
MASRRVRFGLASIGSTLTCLYFLSGYAMHASFSVSNPGQGHERMGLVFLIAFIVSAVLAVAFAITAWWSGRKPARSAGE